MDSEGQVSESYQGSKAALGRGMLVYVNGKRVGEVTELLLSTSVELTANWIPDDAGQIEIMENHKVPVRIELQHPNWVDSALFFLPVEYWYIHITPSDVMTFNVLFRRPDSAVEDGPEVDIIKREKPSRLEFPADWLHGLMTTELADKIVAHARQVLCFHSKYRQRPAGGGFTEVLDNQPDGCKFHSEPVPPNVGTSVFTPKP